METVYEYHKMHKMKKKQGKLTRESSVDMNVKYRSHGVVVQPLFDSLSSSSFHFNEMSSLASHEIVIKSYERVFRLKSDSF